MPPTTIGPFDWRAMACVSFWVLPPNVKGVELKEGSWPPVSLKLDTLASESMWLLPTPTSAATTKSPFSWKRTGPQQPDPDWVAARGGCEAPRKPNGNKCP